MKFKALLKCEQLHQKLIQDSDVYTTFENTKTIIRNKMMARTFMTICIWMLVFPILTYMQSESC